MWRKLEAYTVLLLALTHCVLSSQHNIMSTDQVIIFNFRWQTAALFIWNTALLPRTACGYYS